MEGGYIILVVVVAVLTAQGLFSAGLYFMLKPKPQNGPAGDKQTSWWVEKFMEIIDAQLERHLMPVRETLQNICDDLNTLVADYYRKQGLEPPQRLRVVPPQRRGQ